MSTTARPGTSRPRAALQVLLVAAVVLVFIALGETAGSGARALSPRDIAKGVGLGGGILLVSVAVLLAVFREPWSTLGFRREAPATVLSWGLLGLIASYLVAGTGTVVYALAAGLAPERLAAEKTAALGGFSELPPSLILPLALFTGVYEELVFRGFFLSRLRAALSPDPRHHAAAAGAVVLSSALFAAGHFYQSMLGVVQTFAIGLVLGALAVRRDNVWPCVVAHAGINLIGLTALRFA
ncbi:CPBP family intramembrane glutamic endopeptidase [Sorangium sp. So ce1335]|uniref:CPBP family intramembrane glutamic endopeptidase n=1 Tax=Sorangium sp. So ce1335 TaxID=3133335 RepID=UPI003F602283